MTRSPAHLARLYEEGLSIQAVADRVGLSYSRARRLLLAAGVTFRRPGTLEETLLLAADCAALYGRGLSIRAVAARVGYSYRYTRDLILFGGCVLRDHAGQLRTAAVR